MAGRSEIPFPTNATIFSFPQIAYISSFLVEGVARHKTLRFSTALYRCSAFICMNQSACIIWESSKSSWTRIPASRAVNCATASPSPVTRIVLIPIAVFWLTASTTSLFKVYPKPKIPTSVKSRTICYFSWGLLSGPSASHSFSEKSLKATVIFLRHYSSYRC